MKSDSSASLARIEEAVQRLHRDVLRRSLQVGLPAGVVQSSLSSVGLSSTLELELLYMWKNGTIANRGVKLDDIYLFPGFYMLTLEDAIANYKAFLADRRWKAGWLPLFANGGGDFYVLDLGSPAVGRVRHFRIEESEHPVEFNSLGAMLVTLATAFERDIFFVDPDGYFEMNDLAFADLAAELNRDVEWWRS